MNKLFSNIGKKIMLLAKILFFVNILACFIGGIVISAIFAQFRDGQGLVALGIVITLFGSFLLLPAVWVIYAFGQNVDNLSQIKNHFLSKDDSQKQQTSSDVSKKQCLDSLLKKGVISQEEHDNAIKN